MGARGWSVRWKPTYNHQSCVFTPSTARFFFLSLGRVVSGGTGGRGGRGGQEGGTGGHGEGPRFEISRADGWTVNVQGNFVNYCDDKAAMIGCQSILPSIDSMTSHRDYQEENGLTLIAPAAPRPTAIRYLPQKRSDLSPAGTSSTGQQSVGFHADDIRSTKPIYCQTVRYLIEIASTHDRSGPASMRSLHVFREETAKLGSVRCLVHALDYKDTLIQTSLDLGIRDHPQFKTALEEDQPRLREKVMDVLYCSDNEQVMLSLEDRAAQSLLDIIQFVLDEALLHTRDATSKARRLIRKLAKACDKLPWSLVISGVTQRDEHPTFCGTFGDIFKAMYQGKPVALKRMRMFQGTDQRDIRQIFIRNSTAKAKAKID
ncbi:hypothetical protein R3P38DRAFT_2731285 [Favolaschia claudopus]|uniref:Uncharacterized protein n=1 Tax=Favolaschia claudopus TaxID=2862362 RepID=A0AAW0A5N6_9AGAR